MAVEISSFSPSRRGLRRALDALSAKQLWSDTSCGETHVRQHVSADGYFRGMKVIVPKTKVSEED